MKALQIWSLLAVVVLVAAAVTPCLAQDPTSDTVSSTQSQKPSEAERKAKLKKVNRKFNKRYGKKVPGTKATQIRIDETKNQVRVFNKEAATGKTTASTATKTRPKTVTGQGQTTEANSRTKGSSSGKARVAKKAQNKKVIKKGNQAADKRLQENLRRNEDIRHKGDEARVKRNLAKLKKTMKPGEIARGEQTLKAARAAETAKAAKAAETAKAAKAAEAAKAAKAAEAAKAAKAAEAAKAAKAAEAAKAARAAEAAKAARAAETAKAARAAETAKAARAAEAARATKAAQAAKAARAAKAAQAAKAARAARALQTARTAAAGRRLVTAARAATASTGVGVALVAGSIAAEQIVMQEIEHPGKTARDIGGFFTGLVGTAFVSKPDTEAPNSAVHDTFRIETGKAVVRAVPNGRRGYTKIQFSTNLDWWTAIVVRDISGNVIEVAKSHGRYQILVNQKIYARTHTIEIRSDVLPAQVNIEFWTAKTFGIHKQLVIMKYRKQRLDARTVGITWNK